MEIWNGHCEWQNKNHLNLSCISFFLQFLGYRIYFYSTV